jgi:hypothetical protein
LELCVSVCVCVCLCVCVGGGVVLCTRPGMVERGLSLLDARKAVGLPVDRLLYNYAIALAAGNRCACVSRPARRLSVAA